MSATTAPEGEVEPREDDEANGVDEAVRGTTIELELRGDEKADLDDDGAIEELELEHNNVLITGFQDAGWGRIMCKHVPDGPYVHVNIPRRSSDPIISLSEDATNESSLPHFPDYAEDLQCRDCTADTKRKKRYWEARYFCTDCISVFMKTTERMPSM